MMAKMDVSQKIMTSHGRFPLHTNIIPHEPLLDVLEAYPVNKTTVLIQLNFCFGPDDPEPRLVIVGIPKLEGGCHSSLGSSGDISIFHSVVTRMFHTLQSITITTTPDSSGLRRPPNQTPLCLNGSFPPRPTSHSDRLNCDAPAHQN